MRRLWGYVGEAAVSLWRGWRSSALALAAIVSAVFVLGAFLLVSRGLEQAIGRWTDVAELSVFLADDAAAGEREAIEGALRAEAAVSDIRFVSAEEASRRFARSFPDLRSLVAEAGDAPLPASFEARIAGDVDVEQAAAVAERLRQRRGVADVRLDRDVLARVTDLGATARLVGAVLSGVLVVAAALAVVSVVRLSYVARRDEIEVLYLLGAPLAAIRGPFIAEGALQGLLGTVAALLMLAGARMALWRSSAAALGAVFEQGAPPFLAPWAVLALIGGGLVLGACAGWAGAVGEARGVGIE